MHEYPIEVGDAVCHRREPSLIGEVVHIDRNLPHPTTCNVRWISYDAEGIDDIVWTNKIAKIELTSSL